jgi:hypothetical protein
MQKAIVGLRESLKHQEVTQIKDGNATKPNLIPWEDMEQDEVIKALKHEDQALEKRKWFIQ